MIKQTLPLKPVSRRTEALLRWSSRGFLLAGALALGCSGIVWANAQLYQVYQSWRFDQIIKREPASVIGFLLPWIPRRPAHDHRAGGSWIVDRGSNHESRIICHKSVAGSLIARIQIPRIGLSAIVAEGVDAATLRVAVGHIPGTALPGQPGNVGMAGHRDTFFRALRHIRMDDEITMTTLNGSYRYCVDSTKVVEPEDTKVLNADDDDILTLVTCYPFNFVGSAPKRFIVRAHKSPA